MAKRRRVRVDFETEAIKPRPFYPPKPVGVSIKEAKRKAAYLAWGHPTENNCSRQDALRRLQDLWTDSDVELEFHNAAFDLEVAYKHLNLKVPPWHRIHCTMIQGFLANPHARSLGLKELAHEELGIEPTERDELRTWILTNVPEAKNKRKEWGAYISLAPGALVGTYADGDATRTEALSLKFLPSFDAGLQEAYDRERRLLPHLLEQERQGIRVDHRRLETDHGRLSNSLERLDDWIRKRLKAPELNIDSDKQLVAAIEKQGLVSAWILTAKGNPSTAGDNLAQVVSDKVLVAALGYREPLKTCTNTFMGAWLETANASDGWIYTRWNQTRSTEDKGTRTGRLSSQPNFQNIPVLENVEELYIAAIKHEALKFIEKMPAVRSYILADDDDSVIIDRDYNSQEMRIFSHFEDGELMAGYKGDPWLDTHVLVTNRINELLLLDLQRKHGKGLNFGMLYGEGLGKLAMTLGTDVVGAKKVRDAYFRLFPGAKEMQRTMRARAAAKTPIRTIGGRLYHCEEPKLIAGRMRTFDYKLINYLVQGSSADETKEAIINYFEHPKRRGRWMLTVHDENGASVKRKIWKEEMGVLKEAMEGALQDKIDVPMLSNGSWGKNFHDLEELPNGQ